MQADIVFKGHKPERLKHLALVLNPYPKHHNFNSNFNYKFYPFAGQSFLATQTCLHFQFLKIQMVLTKAEVHEHKKQEAETSQ